MIRYGKPLTILIEIAIVIVIDQIKSIPVQLVIWFVVIRRCGKFQSAQFEEWDDNLILENGIEPSLWNFMRNSVL